MNKKNIVIIIIFFLLLVCLIYISINYKSIQKNNEWSKTYDLNKHEEGYFVLSDNNGGCIALGITKSYDKEDQDIYLLKLDQYGNKIKEEKYGGTGRDYGKQIIDVNDGYVIVGTSNSTGITEFDHDICLIKLDYNFSVIWNHTFGESGIEEANSILQNKDGNFVITGLTNSQEFHGINLLILEIDSNGEKILWNRTYGNNGFDEGRSIVETNDGYVIAGRTKSYSDDSKYSDAWILKINKTGHHVWNYTYGFEFNDLFNQIIKLDDGFIMVGHTSKINENDVEKWNGYIIKTDENGVETWSRKIDEDLDTGISSIVQLDDGFIIVGYIGPYGSDNCYIEKIDNQGDRIWVKIIGDEFSDAGVWIDTNNHDYFFVTGYKDSNGLKNFDLWVLKLKFI